jgi:ABC-type hemin transport system ATPase subunit
VLAIGHDLALAARFADRIRSCIAAGWSPTARAVLTAERIATVFGVEAIITDDASGTHPVLLRPL